MGLVCLIWTDVASRDRLGLVRVGGVDTVGAGTVDCCCSVGSRLISPKVRRSLQ